MIAYNKLWLANQRLQGEVEKALQRGNITQTEFEDIQIKYPSGFYMPNLFVRIGLFILTCVIVSFGDGFISLFAGSINAQIFGHSGYYFFLAILSYAGLELIVKKQNHYRSGVDDALLFISAGQFVAGFCFLLAREYPVAFDYRTLTCIIFIICLWLVIRFNDMLAAAIGSVSFIALIFLQWTKIVPGLATVPFVMMLVTGPIYWFAQFYSNKKYLINYENSFVIVKLISLLALYASGNYYVVQSLSTQLTGKVASVPFGIIFWVWTILLPFVYIFFGIKKKEAILLRLGLLLIAASAVTFRTYYHLLPVDVALSVAGALVLGIVYGIMRYLKTPKHGFTIAEPDSVNLLDHLKVESLIVAETFAHAHANTPSEDIKFGGGDFGGGGSSGDF